LAAALWHWVTTGACRRWSPARIIGSGSVSSEADDAWHGGDRLRGTHTPRKCRVLILDGTLADRRNLIPRSTFRLCRSGQDEGGRMARVKPGRRHRKRDKA